MSYPPEGSPRQQHNGCAVNNVSTCLQKSDNIRCELIVKIYSLDIEREEIFKY